MTSIYLNIYEKRVYFSLEKIANVILSNLTKDELSVKIIFTNLTSRNYFF